MSKELQSLKNAEPETLSPGISEALRASIDDLSRSGIIDRALKVGESAPDFQLGNQSDQLIKLSDCLAHGATVLSFYRGGWCPYCNVEMQALQSALSQIEGLGARILAISPQNAEHAAKMAEQHGLTFDLLSDLHNTVARKFGVVFHLQDEMQSVYDDLGLDLPVWNDDDAYDLPVPATFVIDTNGIIQMAFVDPDYTRRLDPTEIIRALRSARTP